MLSLIWLEFGETLSMAKLGECSKDSECASERCVTSTGQCTLTFGGQKFIVSCILGNCVDPKFSLRNDDFIEDFSPTKKPTTTEVPKQQSNRNYGDFSNLRDLLKNGSVKEIDAIFYPENKKRKGHSKCSVRFDSKSGRYVSSNCPQYVK